MKKIRVAQPETESRSPARSGVAALTAVIVAHGMASLARADAAADWAAADAQGEKAAELPTVQVEEQKPRDLTSPKFIEPLRDTPQTIAVIPSEVYLQQGATTLSDVLRNTAGITFAAGEGGGATSTAGDSFYLRGFDTTNNIFIDGVRDVGAYSRDVFNYDQVEIAKGPAGADIGRGGASGYVDIATKVPRREDFIAGTASYGLDEATSGARRRTTLDINNTLGGQGLKGAAFRLNALWQDSDAVGRDYAENKSWGIAPSLALGLGSPTKAYLTYEHIKQDNLPDYGLPSAEMSGYLSAFPVPQVARSTYYGLTSDYDDVNLDAAMLRIEHEFSGDLKATNQTRYSANQRVAVATTPGSNAAAYTPATDLLVRSRQATKRDGSILSNQTNVTGNFQTGSVVNDFSTGLELSRETSYSPAFGSVVMAPTPIQNPDITPSAGPFPARSGAYTNDATKTAALYFFDTAHLSEQWLANASLRAERYHTDYLSVATTGVPTPLAASRGLLSWKGGLVFKPAPAGSLYVAYAVSLTPPGTDFTLSSASGNQNNPATDPQETKNFEVGTKWDFFHGRLSTTAAVFKTVNDNTVFTDPILGPIATGKQTVQGVELSATRRFTDNWLILASASYLDSEINSGTTAGGNLAGADLPLIPKYSGNLWTSYRFPLGLVIGGGTQYSADVQRRDNSNPAIPRSMPSYWLFNGLITYPVTKRVNLRLNVNNILDRNFVQSFNNNGARYSPGAPRAYTLSGDFRF